MKMKIYLDNSVLNRPFDDQSIPKIRLETTATFFILELIEKRKIKLVNSSVIEYENFKNPFFERKIWISAYLSKASFYQKLNSKIKERAKEIEKLKIPPIDSLHLATAEAAKVDYFITSDYDVIRKYKGKLKVLDPISFIKIFRPK
jgi:predicted nucleic acid-binding protein